MGVAGEILRRVRRWVGFSALDAPEGSGGGDEPDAARAPARRAALHVVVDEGLLRLSAGRLALTLEDGSERTFRLHELAHVSIHGSAGITTPALRALMAEE